jgi:gluconolactonase
MCLRGCFIGIALLLFSGAGFAHQVSLGPEDQTPGDQYVLGPDSRPQPGVPKGETSEFIFDHSRIYPGTSRKITVYVPAEYKGDKPAYIYVGLDGLGFLATNLARVLKSEEDPPALPGWQ